MAVSIYDITSRLRRARRAKELTQEQVSHALGVSQAFVSQIERGLLPEKLSSLITYAQLVDVDVRALVADLAAALGDLETVFRDYRIASAATESTPRPAQTVSGAAA
jgi:transcriptional regulator with XRE-family HTH domain